MALLHMSSLEMGTALQRSLYVTAKVSAESRSPLTLREEKSPVVGPSKATHTWGPQADGPCRAWSLAGRSLGRGSTPGRAGRTCSHSDQAPRRGHSQQEAGANFLAIVQILGRGWNRDSQSQCVRLALLAWDWATQQCEGADPSLAGPWLGSTVSNQRSHKDARGWKQKSSLRVRRWL